MFSGIVQATARVKKTEEAKRIKRVSIEAPRGWKLQLGASVNVDGICSTVVKNEKGFFDVEYMPETLSKTTATLFEKGRIVNLERSLKYGQPIDGHPVQGHVDGATPIRELANKGSSRELTIKPNAALARSAVLHGSVAINGVSLTIARKHGPNITVALIPYTLKNTTLGALKVGDAVNVEFDHSRAYLAAVRKK
jgi:riboflavin synthase alpha subunit